MNPRQLPLRDIHLPDPIGWWPPAIGWWLLGLFIIILIVFLVWLFKRLTRKTAVKSAKKLLLTIKQDKNIDNDQKLQQISMLLRRTAISIYPRQQVAGLTGMAWLKFLDNDREGQPFSQGAGRVLHDGPYKKHQDFDIDALFTVSEQWLKSTLGKTR